MSGPESETENSDWSQENLRKLFAAMKESIPTRSSVCSYSRTLAVLDWTRVAFPPFSPEACKEKWREILLKMRKFRSLTELIDEAENGLQSEVDQYTDVFVGHPAKLPKWTRSVSSKHLQKLTDKQKRQCRVRCEVKLLRLDAKEMGTGVSEKPALNLPSDSEDDEIEYSSSEEEEVSQELHKGAAEEEDGDIMFDIY